MHEAPHLPPSTQAKEAADTKVRALEVVVREGEAAKARLEARNRANVCKFADWKGQFDQLSEVRRAQV